MIAAAPASGDMVRFGSTWANPVQWGIGAAWLGLTLPALAGAALSPGDGSKTDNSRLAPNQYPADPRLVAASIDSEPYDPFFDVDWSVALRGTYRTGTTGTRFETSITPELTLEHLGTRSSLLITSSADLVRGEEGRIDVTGLRLNAAAAYALDSVTQVTAGANITLSRPLPGTPGVASDIAEAARTLNGGLSGGIERQFGRFSVNVSGGIARTSYGPTTLTSGVVNDNTDQNYWSTDASLRVGYALTPIFETFGEVGIGRDSFELASATLGVKPDATDTSLRGGLSANWNDVLTASVSTGVILRRFDADALGSVRSNLIDASLRFAPDETLALTAGLSTVVAPPGPDAAGTTRVEYIASAGVDYTVNSWLKMRAGAALSQAEFIGSDEKQTSYDLTAGADYGINSFTALTADYGFSHANSTSNGIQDAHRVSVGVTISR